MISCEDGLVQPPTLNQPAGPGIPARLVTGLTVGSPDYQRLWTVGGSRYKSPMSVSMVPPPALEPGLPDPVPLIPRPANRPAEVKRAGRARRPLPDAQAITEIDLPDLAPPYDDVAESNRRSRGSRRLTLASAEPDLDLAPAPALPAANQPGIDSKPESASGQPAPLRPAAAPAARELMPGAGTWPSQFAQVLAETLAGSRPAEQLAPWTTQQARRRISQLAPMLSCGPRPLVRRVIVTSPVPDVLEMTAIIAVGPAVHAIAVRLERPASVAAPGVRSPSFPASAARPANPAARPANPATPTGNPAMPPADPAALAALTAAPASLRAARLRSTARWLCTAVEVA